MPLYTFACTECQHAFDLRLGFDADSVAPCPQCGGHAQRRFTPAMTIIFKGKGWRSTQYEYGRDYFGLQKELRDVADRRDKRKGSYEDRQESQQHADERRDTERQTETAADEAVRRGETPDFGGGDMGFGGHGHGH